MIVPLLADHGPRRSHAVLAAERGGATGQGLGVVWPGAPGIVITVPRPVSEAPVAEVAGLLALAIDARAVLVSERDVPRIDDDRFARARERLAPSGDLELRGDASTPRGQPVLHVEQALPQNLDLRALGPAPPRLEWSEPPGLDGPAWGRATRVVLRIHPDDLRAMLAADAPAPHTTPALLPWLAARERGPVLRPLGPAAVPSAAELVFLERRVAAPLLAEPSGDSLQIAGRMAGLVDHVIWNIDRCGAGPCRALTESSRPLAAGWGALVVAGLLFLLPHLVMGLVSLLLPRMEADPARRTQAQDWGCLAAMTLYAGGRSSDGGWESLVCRIWLGFVLCNLPFLLWKWGASSRKTTPPAAS